MKKVTSGSNQDSTTTVVAYLAAGNSFRICSLYMIGESDWPGMLLMTDYEAPLLWRPQGLFIPADIARGQVGSAVGLEVTSLDVYYRPSSDYSVYNTIMNGYYDNWPVRIWKAFMPTPGDVETYGCCELFGGRIGATTIAKAEVHFVVNSFLDVINQQVPNQVIELSNPLEAFEASPIQNYGFKYVPPPQTGV